jgi:hypothetical protein
MQYQILEIAGIAHCQNCVASKEKVILRQGSCRVEGGVRVLFCRQDGKHENRGGDVEVLGSHVTPNHDQFRSN